LPRRDLPKSPRRSKRFLALAIPALLGAAARSARADPTMSECLSANESSIHLRGDHKLRQARDEALICASPSCPDEVRATCEQRITELIATIPTIVLLAKDGAGHDLSAVRVSMDGELLAERLDGTGVAVDPGPHAFTFEVPGQPPVEQSFVIGEGEKDRHETITLSVLPPVASATPSRILQAPVGTPTTRSSPDRKQRIAGITVGAVGVVGLGLGAVFGGLTASEWSSAKQVCAGRSVSCTKSGPGFEDESSAESSGTISTVSFIAGGVLAAAGVVFFVTAPTRSPSEVPASARGIELLPMGGPGGTGLMIRGWL